MFEIVSLNSCMDRTVEVPGFAVGQHCKATLIEERPAGKGVNVARILAGLERYGGLHGFVGIDRRALFGRVFDETRFRCDLIPLDIRTRINTTVLDPENGTETHIREAGEPVRPIDLDELADHLAEVAGMDSWIVFCGSLPPGVSSHAFGELVESLIEQECRIAVDAGGAVLADVVPCGIHLIKPNLAELADLLGQPVADLSAALPLCRELVRNYPRLSVLVSAGAEGALCVSAHGAWRACSTSSVEVKSTVGAGDALLAGYLHGLGGGEETAQCLQAAVRFATSSVMLSGAGEIGENWQTIDVALTELNHD